MVNDPEWKRGTNEMLQETHDAVIRIGEQMMGPMGVVARLKVLEEEAASNKTFRIKVGVACGAIMLVTNSWTPKLLGAIEKLFHLVQ